MVAVSERPLELEPYEYDGIYRPEIAVRYLSAGLPDTLTRAVPPNRRRLQEWIRQGLIHALPRHGRGGSYILTFDDLVTAQAIVLFLEAGHSLQLIKKYEERCKTVLRLDRPFARGEFWYAPRDILAEIGENVFFSAKRPQQLTYYREGMGRLSTKLHFNQTTQHAESWMPWARIELRPDTQFGRSCVAGTSITTSTLWGFVEAGEPVKDLARAYHLPPSDVRDAVRFEQAVRAPVAPAPRVSA